ncbi:MAG: hypothetical protein HRU08_03170 [Oleispira sp.]|nr:hypothetical protein [Oleispira sp.]
MKFHKKITALAIAGCMGVAPAAQAAWWDDAIGWVEDTANDVADVVVDVAEDVASWTGRAANDVTDWTAGAWEDTVDWSAAAWQTTEDFYADVVNEAGTVITYAKNGVGTVALIVGNAVESPVSNYAYALDTSAWRIKALRIQNKLDYRETLDNALFLGTHNSYNAKEYSTSFSYLDPNHYLSIYDQLEAGMVTLELDVHNYTKANSFWAWEWGTELTLCHAKDEHLGCSIYDRAVLEGLAEIELFLSQNTDEVILLYIEDHMDGQYDTMISFLEATIGDRIYRPDGTNGCEQIPNTTLSKQDVLDAGKQVLLYGHNKVCNEATPDIWHTWAYSGGTGKRAFEDRTGLSDLWGTPKVLTADALIDELADGVNFVGLDMLGYSDTDRISAAVWSWNTNEPNNVGDEDCGMMRSDGRWNDAKCTNLKNFACKNDADEWYVTSATGVWSEGVGMCDAETSGAYQFAVPTNYSENQNLLAAQSAAGVSSSWMFYSDLAVEGDWVANVSVLSSVVGTSVSNVDENWQSFTCDTSLVMVGSAVTYSGEDPASVRLDQANCRTYFQEDGAHDTEVAHNNETVDFLAFNSSGLLLNSGFAEVGTVIASDTWTTVNLSNSYINPVVLVQISTYNGFDPATAVLQNISNTSFDVRAAEYEWDDGSHVDETISYVVIEAGTHALSTGGSIEAGVIDISTTFDGSPNFTEVSVAASDYHLVAQVQSNEVEAISSTRIKNKNANSFEVSLMVQESDNNSGDTIASTIGYVAVSQ